MAIAALFFTLAVAFLHLVFMVMETLGWSRMGRRFGFSEEETASMRLLAANQGIYNGAVGETEFIVSDMANRSLGRLTLPPTFGVQHFQMLHTLLLVHSRRAAEVKLGQMHNVDSHAAKHANESWVGQVLGNAVLPTRRKATDQRSILSACATCLQ